MQRSIAAQYPWQNLFPRLNQAFRPARLLRLECSHLHGQFGGTFHILQINKLPSFELGAVRQVGIFSERVVLPASSLVDRGTPPHAGCAVEVEEEPGSRP